MADDRPIPRRSAALLAVVVFVTWSAIPSGLAKLPLRALLKDDLGLEPAAMATFFAVVGAAWYLKPLAGLLSDRRPIRGARRRPYLFAGGLGAALAWTLGAASPSGLGPLLAAMIAVNACAVLANTAAGGLLVDVGQAHGVTGRLSAVRVAAMNAAELLAGVLGGWLAGRSFGWTCATCLGLSALMVTALATLRVDEPPAQRARLDRAALRDAWAALTRREVLAVALLTAAFYVPPGISSLFYYHQRDVLRLSDAQIGVLSALYCAGGIAGAAAYARVCARLSLGTALAGGILLSGASASLYLAYDSLASGLALEPLIGFGVMLGVMPLYDLTARASPPRHEALAFATILAVGNAALAASDVLGTHLARACGLDLADMIAVYAVGTALSGLLIPVVPARLLGRNFLRGEDG